jgi:hypothetical protein
MKDGNAASLSSIKISSVTYAPGRRNAQAATK